MNNLFISDLKEYKNAIENILADEKIKNILYKKEYSCFMKHYISAFQKYNNGGKRVRAYLVKLGYEMSGNNYDNRIIFPSLSYEFFQTGVLIHDDIIDKSTTRRNIPTMHVEFGNNHTAMSKSICVGDLGILVSMEMLAQSDFHDSLIRKAINHQSKVFELTISGELKDIELSENDSYTYEDIIEMYKLKTSWYTIAGPLQLGAILGGASQELLNQIEEAGMAMGIAFQIKDDLLGIFGNESTIGKSNLSDMQEGKKTVLTKHFMENAKDIEKAEFSSIYGNEKSGTEELLKLQELFTSTNSYAYANNLCKQYTEEAKKIICSLNIDNHYQKILLDFLNYLENRKH